MFGLPGTGLYWTEHYPPAAPPHAGHRSTFAVVVIIAVLVLIYVIGAAT